jgi:hypothetical protein
LAQTSARDYGLFSASRAGLSMTSSQSEHSSCVGLVGGFKLKDLPEKHSTLKNRILKKDAHSSLEHQPHGGCKVNTTQISRKIEKPFRSHQPWLC